MPSLQGTMPSLEAATSLFLLIPVIMPTFLLTNSDCFRMIPKEQLFYRTQSRYFH